MVGQIQALGAWKYLLIYILATIVAGRERAQDERAQRCVGKRQSGGFRGEIGPEASIKA